MTRAPYPQVPPSTRGSKRRTGVVIAAVLAVLVGAVLAVHHAYSAGEQNQLSTIRRQMDRVPLPAGASLIDTTSSSANGDAAAFLERTYKLTSARPGAQIRATLAAARYRLLLTGDSDGSLMPVSSADWAGYASARSGDVSVRPSWASSGAIDMQWDGAKLYLRLQYGDLG